MIITYEGLHGLGRGGPERHFQACAGAIGRFTNASEPFRVQHVLDLRDDEGPIWTAAREEMCERHGRYPTAIRGSGADGRPWRAWCWTVARPEVPAAVREVAERVSGDDPVAERLSLKCIWRFQFRDPDTGDLLPGQDLLPRLDDFPGGRANSSSLILNLGRRSAASLWCMFPFDVSDERFLHFVRRLSEGLPFRLRDSGWRSWRLSSKGAWRASRVRAIEGVPVAPS
jgi:hypothetical protein